MALAGRKAPTMPVMSFLLLFPVFLHCHVRVVSQFVYPAERSQGLQVGAFGNPYGTGALNFGNAASALPTVYNNVYPNGDSLQPLPMQRMLQPILQANGIQQNLMPYGVPQTSIQNTGIYNPTIPIQNQGITYNQNSGPNVFQDQLNPSTNQAAIYPVPVSQNLQMPNYMDRQNPSQVTSQSGQAQLGYGGANNVPTRPFTIDERSILPSVYNKVVSDQVLTILPSATERPTHSNPQYSNGYSNQNAFPITLSSNMAIAGQSLPDQPRPLLNGALKKPISEAQSNRATYWGPEQKNMPKTAENLGQPLPAQPLVPSSAVDTTETTTESLQASLLATTTSSTAGLEMIVNPTAKTEAVVVPFASGQQTGIFSELAVQNHRLLTPSQSLQSTISTAENSSISFTITSTVSPSSTLSKKEQLTSIESNEASTQSILPKSFFPIASSTTTLMTTVTSRRPSSLTSTTAKPLSGASHELALLLPVPRNDSANLSKMSLV